MGQLGAAWFIPTFVVTLLLVTHVLAFRILARRENDARSRPAVTPMSRGVRMNEREPADVKSVRDTTTIPAASIAAALADQRGIERCFVRGSGRLPARTQIPRAAIRSRLAIAHSME